MEMLDKADKVIQTIFRQFMEQHPELLKEPDENE
jgi:hypothetical protein